MLKIYQKTNTYTIENIKEIICKMDMISVLYANIPLIDDYIEQIQYLYDVPYYDIVKIDDETIDYPLLRDKFIREHYHTDYEMRLFTVGTAKFSLKIDETIYELTVKPGDLISIPANVNHWFDAGENPNFTAVRFFTDKNGWEAHYVEK